MQRIDCTRAIRAHVVVESLYWGPVSENTLWSRNTYDSLVLFVLLMAGGILVFKGKKPPAKKKKKKSRTKIKSGGVEYVETGGIAAFVQKCADTGDAAADDCTRPTCQYGYRSNLNIIDCCIWTWQVFQISTKSGRCHSRIH